MADLDAAFDALKPRLRSVWEALVSDEAYEHTSLIVPSLSVNQDELAKVTGAAHYEERLMFALIRLRNPNARVIYVTSQPVNPDIVEYYLELLPGVPAHQARKRLEMVSVYDGTSRPLSEKLLERPRFLTRLKKLVGNPERAYLTCYNCTVLEERLAVELGIPLNGVDPQLLYHGTKSGSRKIFIEAGINVPVGVEDLTSEDEIVDALLHIGELRPAVQRAVIKINEGFAGEGNAMFTYPKNRSDPAAIRAGLAHLAWPSSPQPYADFLARFIEMGGIVEEMVLADEVRSPSVQLRIHPDSQCELVSSHEQVLGGATGQVYLGCRFPADDEYRVQLQDDALKIGKALGRHGVTGRFGVDFIVCRSAGEPWVSYAIEINLRMCGTTPPFHALEFLTGGRLDVATGLFRAPGGQEKFYAATDNLKSSNYRGLLPEDLFDIVANTSLHFDHSTNTGVLFYMLGALSQYGKLGMTCVGNSQRQANELFSRTIEVLDLGTAKRGDGHGEVLPLLDRYLSME